ncbi:unnamed protein product [Alternaria sp. RS040]
MEILESLFGAEFRRISILIGLTGILIVVYRLAVPKPLRGIPYNTNSLTPLGDIPSLNNYVAKHNSFIQWMALQTRQLGSPIVQLFIRPFSAPRVVLCDFQETQDILLRRGKEFDRADLQGDLFRPLVPNHHIMLKTDAVFKAHKKLLQDLMTPAFLNEVAAPAIYASASNVVHLWEEKRRLAQGRPFQASEDLFRGALDAVLAFTFGPHFAHNATKTQLRSLSEVKITGVPGDNESPAEIPTQDDKEEIMAVLNFTHGADKLLAFPLPSIAYAFMKLTPSWTKTMAIKNRLIDGELRDAVARFDPDSDATMGESAVDCMIRRESRLAAKEDRKPEFHSDVIKDEIMGFIVAGHETSSTALSWAIKYLADHPTIQETLRAQLQSAMPQAISDQRWPSHQEIVSTSMPFLDACLEEILRCARTVPFVIRQATCDTQILGYHVPQGTEVYMIMDGPSVFSRAFEIPDENRTESARAATLKIAQWDPTDITAFNPRRWLRVSGGEREFEKMVFDNKAGPSFPFGLGVRSCFGKRLAYLELRLLLALLIWNFELQTCSSNLSAYNVNEGFTRRPINCYVKLQKVL